MTISHSRIQRYTVTACFGALAFVLMLFEFPVIPMVSYLKFDFSDLPAMLGTVMYGPVAGLVITLIKLLLHGATRGFSPVELLGLFASLCSSLSLLLPVAWFFRKGSKLSLKRALTWSGISGTVILTVVMTVFNLYVLTPMYMKLFGWQPTLPIPKLMAFGVLPFNLIKGAGLSLVFAFVITRMRHYLHLGEEA